MTKIKIEKGVKMPSSPTGNKQGDPIYPWHEMEIGDSFFVKCDNQKRTSILTTGRLYLKYNQIEGVRFSSRREGDGYRFWKIST